MRLRSHRMVSGSTLDVSGQLNSPSQKSKSSIACAMLAYLEDMSENIRSFLQTDE